MIRYISSIYLEVHSFVMKDFKIAFLFDASWVRFFVIANPLKSYAYQATRNPYSQFILPAWAGHCEKNLNMGVSCLFLLGPSSTISVVVDMQKESASLKWLLHSRVSVQWLFELYIKLLTIQSEARWIALTRFKRFIQVLILRL